ncbi:uncharacterized protein [Primulina eburnea]|uniref:uncharacterized protein n=1 Tax=Primulina eburnea TaxID=1245227 RepID=UPI003C6C008C
MAMMRNSMNADISDYKAWKGKELADNMLKGDPTQSFTKLSCYLHMVEQMNPGSITDIFVDEENRFKYMFLALVHALEDIEVCEKLYQLMLLEVVPDEDELVIISDRHQGIINAVSTVYRNVHHGHCTWHLSQNMKTICKKKGATEMFCTLQKFIKLSSFILHTMSLGIDILRQRNIWMRETHLIDGLERYCPKTHYNIMTTNGVESINARLLEERKLPIIALLDSLQRLASSWFARYRHVSIASNTNLTPTIEGILRSRFTDAQGMQVFELGRMEFDVRSRGHSAIVDLESKRCTCRVFDIDRIPCAHAIAASWLANIDLYDMCSRYYSTMSWCMADSETVYPVPEENEWPRNINFPLVLPPLLEKRVGRRKQNRFPSIGEFSKR